MNIWSFAGSYWWLIFPMMGIAGGFVRRWELGARDRHERRLELLAARAELKTAGGQGNAPVTQTPGTDSSGHETLSKITAREDDITRRWLDYELDIAKTIAFPTMTDGRNELTAGFLRAKKKADALRPEASARTIDPTALVEYRDAVSDYETAFELAEREARRLRDSGFTEPERKRLRTATQLLTIAVDNAATPAERQLAYRRVREELDGLIALSDDAIEQLEQKVAQALPPAAS